MSLVCSEFRTSVHVLNWAWVIYLLATHFLSVCACLQRERLDFCLFLMFLFVDFMIAVFHAAEALGLHSFFLLFAWGSKACLCWPFCTLESASAGFWPPEMK